ncbi:glycosyltransferase [Candidatus Gracilibacteria bacterium]|nr:glycosyltransferase [Candidatus Gracilibacteria bacterium]
MKTPLVSIIMSTYNGSKYITFSIESVLTQSYKNFEFIIINDCSDDDVEKIIQPYIKRDSRIVYKKNKKNLKLTKSLNFGLSMAKGKYIARVDDDDTWSLNKLEKQVDFMESHKEHGLCGSNYMIIDQDGKRLHLQKMRLKDKDIKNHLLQSNQFAHSSIIMRKISLEKAGGLYNPTLNGVEDYDLWLRIGKISKLANINETLMEYRFLPNSAMRKNALRRRILSFKVAIMHRDGYPNFIKSFILRMPWLILNDSTFSKVLALKDKLFK